MNKLVIALLASGLWSSVHAETLDLTPYNTSEYTANTISAGKTNDDFLRVINTSSAWARGYTGKGSTILIIDSGINTNHKEFAGSILFQKDFIKSKHGITDVVGHGSGLAGIAAANWDGVGMVGVAPDANLAIAKVTDSASSFNFVQARNALVWGNQVGAVVANISANVTYDATYNKNWTKLSDGTYWNKDARYTGRYFGGDDPYAWANALGKEMVLVNSAGNSGLRYPQQPGTLATATDAKGNLILGGQVLIVGAYDITNNNIASYSNRAGHICHSLSTSGTCADKYRVSQFYILAPGNAFTADDVGSNYVIQTGTSQAAAVVSGSVAVINQMWPYMKGENIVKLLTATANKNIAGYDPDVHGQGLLDLEKATRPFGNIGIPTTGRTGKIAVNGGFTTNTSGGLSSLSSKLSSVVVTDEFGRDYRVDLSTTANNKRARADFNPVAKAQFYDNYNPYNKLNFYSFSATVPSGEYDIKLAANDYTGTAMLDVGKNVIVDNVKYRVGFGMLNERDAWMGNSIGGMFGQVRESYTQFTNFSGSYNLNKQVSVFGSTWLGYTTANLASQGLITNVGDTQSYSWNAGVDYTKDSHSFGATVSQPVTVYRGSVNVALPVNVSADGTVNFSKERVSIASSVVEYDVGAYYKYKAKGTNLIAYTEHQMNYLNQAGVTNNQVGFALAKEW